MMKGMKWKKNDERNKAPMEDATERTKGKRKEKEMLKEIGKIENNFLSFILFSFIFHFLSFAFISPESKSLFIV